MKNILITCLIVTSCIHSVKAQSDLPKPASNNNYYFDAGTLFGLGVGSFNFESKLLRSKSKKFTLYARAGLGYLYYWGWYDGGGMSAVGGPVGLTMLMGGSGYYFEISAGAFVGYFKYRRDFSYNSRNPLNAFPLLEIAYRYQNPVSGFLFRAKVGTNGGGISIGRSF